MNQLYKIQTKLFEKHRINEQMLEEVITNAKIVFRSHTVELLDLLLMLEIPLYIISGGISDTIYNSIHCVTQKSYPNISIHSNELENYFYSLPDDAIPFETVRFIRFKKKIIHSYNKYRVMNNLNKRKNCILMGDLVSDIHMAEGNDYETILSVFYGKEGETDQRG